MTGNFNKEKQLYKIALIDFPDNPTIMGRQAILLLMEGGNTEADEFLEKFTSLRKETSVSESNILQELAYIYSEAGRLEKAEELYRQALSMEPENDIYLNNLAYFIFKYDTTFSEGLIMIEKALKSNPNSPHQWMYLATKGELMFKQQI